ncbi:MAG: helix-turn-helix transcriptional regulator [Oscillospiraceae bacterium]|nr:helix-turn-helix transcriptional regulator [Oscillospiraceae bacterium]
MIDDYGELQKRVLAVWDSSGMSDAEIAEASGVPLHTIQRYRRDAGKNPSWSTIANTVAVCGASIDELVGITGPAQHPDAADAHHVAYVEDLHRGCRKERQKWQRLSFILIAVVAALALLIAGVAVYDLLHASAGWFQYAKQVAEGYVEQTAAFFGLI